MGRRGGTRQSKYQPLADALAALPPSQAHVTYTLDEVALMIGGSLPPSGQAISFWMGMAPLWRRAGWLVTGVYQTPGGRALSFRRIGAAPARAGASSATRRVAGSARAASARAEPAAENGVTDAGMPATDGETLRTALRRGLLSPKTVALLLLARAGPLPVFRLGLRAGLSPTSTTQLVYRLEEAGLIVRHAHPTDRRVHLLALTEQGRAATAILRAALVELVTPHAAPTAAE